MIIGVLSQSNYVIKNRVIAFFESGNICGYSNNDCTILEKLLENRKRRQQQTCGGGTGGLAPIRGGATLAPAGGPGRGPGGPGGPEGAPEGGAPVDGGTGEAALELGGPGGPEGGGAAAFGGPGGPPPGLG